MFDQGFGDLLVTHIAGNVATNENLGSSEFGTSVLGAKVLYVLGYTCWGAVTTALKRRRSAGTNQRIVPTFASRRKPSRDDLTSAVQENVRNQTLTLASACNRPAALADSFSRCACGTEECRVLLSQWTDRFFLGCPIRRGKPRRLRADGIIPPF